MLSMKIRLGRSVVVLCGIAVMVVGVIVGQHGVKAADEAAGATRPAGGAKGRTVPEGLPLEGKLVLKKATYVLAKDQAGEEFAKKVQKGFPISQVPPAPPKVEMEFVLTNTGTEAVRIPVGADSTEIDLKLEGDGAVSGQYMQMHTMEYRGAKAMTIEPGKSLTLPIKQLSYGNRGDTMACYWTKPGVYTLTASYVAPVMGLDNAKFKLEAEQAVTIEAAPVKVTVTEGK